MTPLLLSAIVLIYFAVLLSISYFTSKNTNSESFFNGNKTSSWYVVAYGMIGASLSGVTFMSVPGSVAVKSFSYMQMVFGYLFGYIIISYVLLPIYYRLNVTSIYSFIENQLGFWSYKSSAIFFLLSRIIGASFRLFLVAIVFQSAIIEPLGVEISFTTTVCITIFLIWVYTFKGGMKTIIWTDTLQTTFMIGAVISTVIYIANNLPGGGGEIVSLIRDSEYSKLFFFENVNSNMYFPKLFLSGIFMTIVMTGMDQDMMQKNLTCKNLKEAQKNMMSLGAILIPINLIFLALGALLFLYAESTGMAIPPRPDLLFSKVALSPETPIIIGILFIIGLIAAAYSSADSALTSLTTSTCYDILNVKSDHKDSKKIRTFVHIGMSIILILVIVFFKSLNDESVITKLFKIAGYTYGPILGLFLMAIYTKTKPMDRMVPFICLIAPTLSYIIQSNSVQWLNGYEFGFEILIVNGLITFTLLYLSSFLNP